jgi:hypothetical protein
MSDKSSEIFGKTSNAQPIDLIDQIVDGKIKVNCTVKDLIDSLAKIVEDNKTKGK